MVDKPRIVVIQPEEAAGLAGDAVYQELIAPFAEEIGVEYQQVDWSVENRIKTDGKIVSESVSGAIRHRTAVLLKGPGITPTEQQIEPILKTLGDTRTLDQLPKLSKGSPNGFLRKKVEANVLRFSTSGVDDLMVISPPDYSKSAPITTLHLENDGAASSGFTEKMPQDGGVEVDWVVGGVAKRMKQESLAQGSPVSVRVIRRKDVEALCESALKQPNVKPEEIRFMSKYTVLKGLDGEIKRIWNATREKHGLPRQDGNVGDIVDAAFAKILVRPPVEPAVCLIPDWSYGPKIAAVLKAALKEGLRFPPEGGEIALARFSAGGSEYDSVNEVAKEDGVLKVTFGGVTRELQVAKGDMFLAMHFNIDVAKTYISQMFDIADHRGYNEIIFGFTRSNPMDACLVDALAVVAKQMGRTEGKDFRVVDAQEAAILLFCRPSNKKTLYVLDNLWGDIVSDGMFLNKGIASGSSILVTYDGRTWPEMGGAGTAPDLIPLREKEGFMRYNPMPIIEGYALAVKEASRLSGKEAGVAAATFADALHDATLDTIREGIITPDLRKAVKATSGALQLVGMEGFIQATKVNLLKRLGKKDLVAKEAETLRNLLSKQLPLVQKATAA